MTTKINVALEISLLVGWRSVKYIPMFAKDMWMFHIALFNSDRELPRGRYYNQYRHANKDMQHEMIMVRILNVVKQYILPNEICESK